MMSSENTISAVAAAIVSSPISCRRLRCPRSLQRPTKGRSSIGTNPKPPTISPICHFDPPIEST